MVLAGVTASGLLTTPVRGEEVIEIATRPGQTVRALLIDAPAPKGGVILLAGGRGHLRLSNTGAIGWGRRNQLVRTRALYARAGFVTVLPDIASDLAIESDDLHGYRVSEAHADDIGFIVAHLRSIVARVYLIGTSSAALSVANAASRLAGTRAPDGIVITSGMLMHVDIAHPSVQTDVPRLASIKQPTLLVSHQHDVCAYSMPSSAAEFRPLLTGAARVDSVALFGGHSGDGEPCGPESHHGFLGMDSEVVGTITTWLHSLPRLQR